jgi:hypothetical protein
MKSGELQLTKEVIANEGIEIKLTQSDVIDMLVQEQLDQVRGIAPTLMETRKNIISLVERERDAAVDRTIKALVPKIEGLTITNKVLSYRENETVDMFYITESTMNNGTVKYNMQRSLIDKSHKGMFRLEYETVVGGITLHGKSQPYNYEYTLSDKILELIEENNAKVKEFIASIPESGINEKELAKRIKNQFTKEILQNSSADFKKKLKKSFAIHL